MPPLSPTEKKQPRTSDRHRLSDHFRRPNRKRSDNRRGLANRLLVSVDSEAATDPDGYHRLIMVTAGAEDGRAWTLHGSDLGTREIFEWLTALPALVGCPANYLMYSGMYDADMWLKDVHLTALRRIADEKSARWQEFRIAHLRHHTTSIAKFDGRKSEDKIASILLWDVIGFFQQSFVKTLRDWKIGDDETVSRIEDMKLQRSTFTEAEREQITAYNVSECLLLCQVVRRLISLCQDNDIQLTRLDGAGAAAAAMLRKYGVERYLVNPPEVEDYARWALFGGRIDISRAAMTRGVFQYDINSAYPAACETMPCWSCGVWREASELERPLPLGMYRVLWDWSQAPQRLAALPFRREDGGIRYPATGQGHYWSTELNELSDEQWRGVRVLSGMRFIRGCEHKPFAFIPEIYAARRKLKAAGNLGHLVLKLPLNAMYGKLAQAGGFGGKRPRYQSFVAASYVTAWCRARIIAAMRDYLPASKVLAIATDGILTTERMPATLLSNELGGWEESEYEHCFIVQPGVYALWANGKRHDKTRGADRASFDFDALVSHWREVLTSGVDTANAKGLFGALSYRYTEPRFFGLKLALTRLDWPQSWRRWAQVERSVTPASSRHLSVGRLRGKNLTIDLYSPMNGTGDCDADDKLSNWNKLYPDLVTCSARYEPKREATWTEDELLHHYMPDPLASDYRVFDR